MELDLNKLRAVWSDLQRRRRCAKNGHMLLSYRDLKDEKYIGVQQLQC